MPPGGSRRERSGELGAAAEHRVWVGVLLLQSLLPACSALPWEWLRTLFAWAGDAHRAGEAHVSVVMGAGTGLGALHLPAELLTAIAIAYCDSHRLFRRADLSGGGGASPPCGVKPSQCALTGEAAIYWAQCSKRFGIDNVSIAASSRIFGPVTIGLSRKLVLLPASMTAGLPEADLRAVIAHEFAHMRRNDFLKNLIYELLSLPVSYHPVFWLTRERIMESREMVCDQIAAEMLPDETNMLDRSCAWHPCS